MDNNQILPELSLELLKEKANEFAMKGAIETIKDYYSGYSSPFRKAIEEELKKTQIGTGIDLPDIIALINQSLSNEIDAIANTAVSKTFIPMVQRFLVREEKEMKFSEILKQFIEDTDTKSIDDCSIEMTKSHHGWYNLEITSEDNQYSLTLHDDWDSKNEEVKKFQFLSLPYDRSSQKQTMKLSIDGVGSLEMPFTMDVLKDNFTAFIARLIIGKTKITIDCKDFDEDMFPQDECHC